MTKLEIYDCTPRDGVQAEGASINEERRKNLVMLLDGYGMHFIEAGWPTKPEIVQSIRELTWKVKKSKVVAFGSTSHAERVEEDPNLRGILDSRATHATIFGKTWKDHIDKQLRISYEANLKKIEESVKFLTGHGRTVFYDAEHYFDGFRQDPEYAVKTLIAALSGRAQRFILCDTIGGTMPFHVHTQTDVLQPEEIKSIMGKTVRRLGEYGIKDPESLLGVHFHNDKGLALANALISLPYVTQMQGTINGYGERVGNLNLNQFLCNYALAGGEVDVDLKRTKEVYEKACKEVGLPIDAYAPFVGENAGAHKGGVHVNALGKGASYEPYALELVGNKRKIVLNTQGGKSAIIDTAKEFGYLLDWENPAIRERGEHLFRELAEMENEGYAIGTNDAEKRILIERYFGNWKSMFKILDWEAKTSMHRGSDFDLLLGIQGKTLETKVHVPHPEGAVDAGWKAFRELMVPYYPALEGLILDDYKVLMLEHKKEESPVRTEILFSNGKEFSTVGVHTNSFISNVISMEKGFTYHLNQMGKSI
ncbi:MAG: hypothetical protein WCK90_05385 [archaeon]